jgi:hypothetical protein
MILRADARSLPLADESVQCVGTVGVVCERLGRRWVGTEPSAEYIKIAKRRTRQMGLFAAVAEVRDA